MRTVAIVGGGPAGISCAKMLHAAEVDYVVIDNSPLGGSLRVGYDFEMYGKLQNSRAYAKELCDFSIKRLKSSVTKVSRTGSGWRLHLDDGELECSHLVIATGVQARTGGFKESSKMVIGPFKMAFEYPFQGKRIAVLGGGDNAFEYASIAMKRGAATVTVFAKEIKARRLMVDEASRHKNMKVQITGAVTVEDKGEITVNCDQFDACLVMYGFESRMFEFKDCTLEIGKNGRFETNMDEENNLYAVGDCVQGELNIPKAMTQGAQCGLLIIERIASVK